MSNLVIGYADWSDEATIDSSSAETSGFPVENLQSTQPTDYWESQTTTPFVVLDRGNAQDFNVIALLYTNVQSGDTWQVRAADTEANLTASPGYDSGSVTFRVPGDDDTWDRHHGFLFLSTTQAYRWIRIALALGTGADLEAGRLIIGDFYQPSVNDSYGRRFGVSDPSTTSRTDGGGLISDERSRFLNATVTLDFQSEADVYGSLFEIRRLRGTSKDILLVLDPDEDTYLMQQMIYGRITADDPFVYPNYNRFRHRFRVEEGL